MRITGEAESWLKNNLNISVPDLLLRSNDSRDNIRVQSANPNRVLNRYSSARAEDLR